MVSADLAVWNDYMKVNCNLRVIAIQFLLIILNLEAL